MSCYVSYFCQEGIGLERSLPYIIYLVLFYRKLSGAESPRVIFQPTALAQLSQTYLRATEPKDRSASWTLAHTGVFLAGPEQSHSGE